MATKATDNRYGRVKYNQTKYGASAMETLAWGVEVDWDNNGAFDGSNEAEWMVGIHVDRGRKSFIRPRGDGLESPMTGTCKITLDNTSGRYDAWNTSSPLYPYVMPGLDIRVRVRDMATGTMYPVFYGMIENIQTVSRGNQERVVITAVDGWRYLRDNTARVALVEDVTPEAALGYILDSVKWPYRWGRAIGSSSDNINYWWADGNKLSGTDIEELVNSFLGYFFIAADGKATYIHRNDVSGGSVYDYNQDELLTDLNVPQPWEMSRNVIRLKTHPRTQAATGVIWQLVGDVPSLGVGAANALTIWANYTYSNASVPAINIVTPVATTDYTMNTAADGSGTDKTADCTVTITDFGSTAKLVVTNNSAGTVYITKLQVRGDAIYEVNAADVTYPDDTTTVANPRDLRLDLLWQQNVNVATDFSNVLGPFFGVNQMFPRPKIEARPAAQFTPDLFDIVTATIEKLGINGEVFRVGGITHQSLSENCQAIETTLYLEPYIFSGAAWTFPITNFGTDTVFGA